MSEFLVQCWNCLGEFDAAGSVWCSCNPNHPTKVCPFCLQCFCAAPETYQEHFWSNAPEELVRDRETLASARGPLGEALVRARAITSDQLLLALKRQQQAGGRLGEILVELGFLNQETLDAFLAHHRPVMNLSLKDAALDPLLITAVGPEECLRRLVVPVSKESLGAKGLLTLAMVNPSDGESIEHVQNMTGCQILPVRVTQEEVEEVLSPYLNAAPLAQPPEGSSGGAEPAAPANQVATDLLRKALARGASDLYLEPKEDEVSVHLRIDGALYRAKPIPTDFRESITRDLKQLLRLDTAITDRPQEGRVVMRSGPSRFDVIAHCLPTRLGENLSLRFINRDTFLKTYDQLGIPQEDQRSLRTALSAQRGLVIISAPLFHGSTTTLYAVLSDLAQDPARKVMSIEAQSVCPVDNVTQVSLGDNRDSEATGTTLKALASIQPDVCILADILDSHTMASQMLKFVDQMLVVATVQASHAATAVQQLVDLGVPAAEMSQQLLLVLNQRLVRSVCPTCAKPAGLSTRTLRMMGLTMDESTALGEVVQGQGCEECSGIGYRGRFSLFETLVPSAAFRKAVARRASDKILEREALKGGMTSLRARALDAVRQGRTTIEEFQKGNF